MPRGGRRIGAGAKPGNTNALKTGEFSRRAKGLHKAIVQWPGVMDYVWRQSKGDPSKIETVGYALRYLGDELIRAAQARSGGKSRRPSDAEVLLQTLRRWQPRTPPGELQ
jgi:hypothetical protein